MEEGLGLLGWNAEWASYAVPRRHVDVTAPAAEADSGRSLRTGAQREVLEREHRRRPLLAFALRKETWKGRRPL